MKIIFISILIIFIIINLNLNLNLNINKYIEHFRLDFMLKEIPTKDKKINLHFYTNKGSLKASYLKLVGEYFYYNLDQNIESGLINHTYNTHPGDKFSTRNTLDFNKLYHMINNNILKQHSTNKCLYLWDEAYNKFKNAKRGPTHRHIFTHIIYYKFIDIKNLEIKIIHSKKNYTFEDNYINFINVNKDNIKKFNNLLEVRLFLDKYKREKLRMDNGKEVPISTLSDIIYIDDTKKVQFNTFYNEVEKLYKESPSSNAIKSKVESIKISEGNSNGLSMYGHMINNSNSTGKRNITFTQICDNSYSHTSNCKKNSNINNPSNTIDIYSLLFLLNYLYLNR